MSSGTLTRRQHHNFVRYESLRKEYLNQTFNFMPELQVIYDKNSRGQNYEDAQKQITGKEDYSQLGKYRQIRITFFRNFIIGKCTKKWLNSDTSTILFFSLRIWQNKYGCILVWCKWKSFANSSCCWLFWANAIIYKDGKRNCIHGIQRYWNFCSTGTNQVCGNETDSIDIDDWVSNIHSNRSVCYITSNFVNV